MLLKNQRGLSLVELLATITILSTIGILIWGVFFQGTKHSKIAISKNQMQQEANIIISKLTKVHQTATNYSILSNDGKIVVTYENKYGVSDMIIFEGSNYKLITSSVNNLNPGTTDLPLTITLTDNNNSKNSISVNTKLYRLKGGG